MEGISTRKAPSTPASCQFAAGDYHTNYYVRRLLGSCGNCAAGNPHKVHHQTMGCPTKSIKLCLAKRDLQAKDLQQASNVLSRFDVVLITELLKDAAHVLAAALGFGDDANPMHKALKDALHTSFTARPITHHEGKQVSQDIPPAAREALFRSNALDVWLYERARADFLETKAKANSKAK